MTVLGESVVVRRVHHPGKYHISTYYPEERQSRVKIHHMGFFGKAGTFTIA